MSNCAVLKVAIANLETYKGVAFGLQRDVAARNIKNLLARMHERRSERFDRARLDLRAPRDLPLVDQLAGQRLVGIGFCPAALATTRDGPTRSLEPRPRWPPAAATCLPRGPWRREAAFGTLAKAARSRFSIAPKAKPAVFGELGPGFDRLNPK